MENSAFSAKVSPDDVTVSCNKASDVFVDLFPYFALGFPLTSISPIK